MAYFINGGDSCDIYKKGILDFPFLLRPGGRSYSVCLQGSKQGLYISCLSNVHSYSTAVKTWEGKHFCFLKQSFA